MTRQGWSGHNSPAWEWSAGDRRRAGAPAAVPASACWPGGYEAAAERAVGLGATRLADGPAWVTLADPAGHPSGLCQKDGVGPVMGLFAVTTGAPDAPALARFYAGLLGMEVTYEGPEGALIAGDGKNVMSRQVSGYNPPRWPDPAHPQQAHPGIIAGDLDAAGPGGVGQAGAWLVLLVAGSRGRDDQHATEPGAPTEGAPAQDVELD
jgi:catechol 2,3-dioxygenase-like lactoylglutathione lyase family enzyme